MIKLKEKTDMQSGIYMKADPKGKVKYIQIKDINPEGVLEYSQMATVNEEVIGSKHWLKKNDLLFAAKGTSNYCILYDGSEEKIIASSSFIIIQLKEPEILPEFLCCYLNTPSILKMLKSAAVGTGIQMIPKSVLENLQFKIPSIEVQQKIVRMDRLRKEAEKVQNLINEHKRNLQDKLLMDSLK